MPKTSTSTELRRMQPDDLRKEIATKRSELSKMSIGIELKSFKDTAKYSREKKELARMHTILGEQERANQLKESSKSSTVPASTK